eukprot:comp21163_c0_seq1/m.28668 comp21163_c0_seq1/g.28668  ORF comp21163_c0_seq1/g.28668 comp21163_c0_seq1/m.28668 type:complete len:354 (-) comp21163_c0_seq1:402-1463(-)
MFLKLLHITALAFGASAMSLPASNGNSSCITVVSYNIDGRPCYIGHDGQYERIDRIAEVIDSQLGHVDFVVFQEAFEDTARKNLESHMYTKGFKYVSPVLDAKPKSFTKVLNGGVLIASRWPVEFVKMIGYSHCALPDCFANKGALYVKTHVSERVVHLFGTHMQSWGTKEAVEARQQQGKEMRNFADSLNIPATDLVLYVGDLNVDIINTPDEVISVLNALNATLPQVNGLLNATSQPSTNKLVGSDTAAKKNGCSGQYDYGRENCACCYDQWLDYVLVSNQHYQPSTVKFEAVKVKAPEPFEVCMHSYLPACSCTERSKFQQCAAASSTCLQTRFIEDVSDHYPVRAQICF